MGKDNTDFIPKEEALAMLDKTRRSLLRDLARKKSLLGDVTKESKQLQLQLKLFRKGRSLNKKLTDSIALESTYRREELRLKAEIADANRLISQMRKRLELVRREMKSVSNMTAVTVATPTSIIAF